ncbi:Aste57867_15448 [Aphanomyces stellatus]|uniref:Aste57867_15448 protein n=1 Tax=Aphanomyces stellatus TaxID=120398 RepID=A0A485L453_9STRA|nr:hypothetical protein As57867_015392 [Aphanomyces stellatus]VFT92250.1 Aste57867_15448 [Aphanomyces stellatus]
MSAAAASNSTLLARVDQVLAGWNKATAPVKTKSNEAAPHVEPKPVSNQCHPNNRKDFQARVATFSTLHWFAKPVELNLLACARYGWINTGPDELSCKCCDQTLNCRIDSRLGPEGAKKVAEGLHVYLTDHHLDTCPWKYNPSPITFTQIRFWTQDAAVEFVLAAIKDISNRWIASSPPLDASFLAQLQGRLGVSPGDFDTHMDKLVRRALGSDEAAATAPGDAARRAAIVGLAISGWQVVDGDRDGVTFGCPYCNRTLDTKDFLPHDASSVLEKDVDEPAPKRAKVTPRCLCPLQEHRWFCPWQRGHESGAAAADNDDNDVVLAGWVQCAEATKSLLLVSTTASTFPSVATTTGAATEGEEQAPVEPAAALASVKALLDFS